MKTKQLNLIERMNVAKRNVRYWQNEMVYDLANDYEGGVEYDLQKIKDWTRYMKNTCNMHGYVFTIVMLN